MRRFSSPLMAIAVLSCGALLPRAGGAAPLPSAVTPVAVRAAPVAAPSRAEPGLSRAGPRLPPADVTVALSAVRLLLPLLQVKGELHVSRSLLAGGFLSWGSPSAEVLDEKTQVEVGAHVGAALLGDNRRGLGLVAQGTWLRAWGRLGELKATSYGFSAALLASGRWTFDNDMLIECQYGADYLYSYAGLHGRDDGSWKGSLSGRFNLWLGFSF